MRINKYVAQATGLSRRAADAAITEGRVQVNDRIPEQGYDVTETDQVTLDSRLITPPVKTTTVMMNKPVGYVVSRNGQGSHTVYELLPPAYQNLKPVGRLDKDSSGLLLLTDDGQLAHELTHPSRQKEKVYEIRLYKALTPDDRRTITTKGVQLEDGISTFRLDAANDQNDEWKVVMSEGRNRQIRRTFEALGYTVKTLHRIHFGPYVLGSLKSGDYRVA
jgi:23S rRNA pseudouridine2605 synthase